MGTTGPCSSFQHAGSAADLRGLATFAAPHAFGRPRDRGSCSITYACGFELRSSGSPPIKSGLDLVTRWRAWGRRDERDDESSGWGRTEAGGRARGPPRGLASLPGPAPTARRASLAGTAPRPDVGNLAPGMWRDMTDPRRVVEQGYDAIADRYLELSATDDLRMQQVSQLVERLPPGAQVLELGCGAGVPVAEALAERYFLTGVDISRAQLERARVNVSGARFIQADMSEIGFASGTFDAVVALYSIIHVPRDEQARLLTRMREWIKPGGYLLINTGTVDDPGTVEEDWLGAPMFFSSFDPATNKRLIDEAGFDLLDAQVILQQEEGTPVSFLWVLARARPADP
jgi:ubiquinone/menaquinone biosynthesis C-methylase UbiE